MQQFKYVAFGNKIYYTMFLGGEEIFHIVQKLQLATLLETPLLY